LNGIFSRHSLTKYQAVKISKHSLYWLKANPSANAVGIGIAEVAGGCLD